MARILLLSVDRALAARLEAATSEHVKVDLVQSLEGVEQVDAALVVVDHAAIPPERSVSATIAEVVAEASGRAVVLATHEMDGPQVLQAIRAGATDVIAREAEGRDVGDVLARVLNASMAGRGGLARLTLVLGTDEQACAVAATDMAIALAQARSGLAHPATLPGERDEAGAAAPGPVLLVDCTLPTSIAEAYLDLKVDYGIADAFADIERLDASLLADALARHEGSGISLITLDGGTASEPAGIGPADVVSLIQLLRASAGHVVVCAGSLRHAGLLRELASLAHAVEILCPQSIRALDETRRLMERVALDTASLRSTRLVVWDHDARVLLDGRRMADVLGLEAVVGLPVDRVAMLNALNAGEPLLCRREISAYAQGLRRICALPQQGRTPVFPGLERMKRALLRQAERTA